MSAAVITLMAAAHPLLYLCLWLTSTEAQIAWTSIYVDGNSQVDLWTQEAEGCQCPWDTESTLCACCVKNGGCHCGMGSPHRCMQCGLEEHCSHMCNMTIDSTTLLKQSGKTFGQIKSPSIEGPGTCWYTFLPDSTQRVELQIYRLVSVGRYNGTGCENGYLQLSPGREQNPEDAVFQLCGANERYTPPVVLFSDHGESTLVFRINEKTLRSQFLAYFSFTSINNTQGLGYQPKGGTKLQNTDCDWLYQDFSCRRAGSCVLASTGYPGVYPPNRKCNYHVTTSSIHTRVRVTFVGLLLPYNHCDTDYVSIYQGSTTSSPHLITLCGNRRTELEYSGPNLLLEFSSGAQVPPFDYNGFLATLEFSERSLSTELPVALTAKTIEGPATVDRIYGTIVPPVLTPRPGCDVMISGNDTRSGHFDTRAHDWHPNCRFVFKGRTTDVVHVSLFNYRLRSPACNTIIEIIDGVAAGRKKVLQKICSPQIKHARDHGGSFLEHQTYISTNNIMTLLLRKPVSSSSKDVEFVDGAYLFHDEQVSGTLQPSTICDVHFYGMSSPSVGMIDNPGSQHLYWNIEGPLRCSQQFIPGANQSIAITIRSLGRMVPEPKCQTQCGDGGCVCVPLTASLSETDHILLVSESGHTVTCLCGDFPNKWMPVSVRSWGPLSVIYSVAHYTWNTKGFEFAASYIFNNDDMCGKNTITLHTGEIKSKNITSMNDLNYFYHQNCIWTLDSNVERQLFIELSSHQNRPCNAWNISVHEYSSNIEDQNHLGELLYTFCPRDKHKTYSLPWKLNTVIVRLSVLSRTPPQYKIKWRSQVVRANTRLGSPTPAPNAVSGSEHRCFKDVTVTVVFLIFTVLNFCNICRETLPVIVLKF